MQVKEGRHLFEHKHSCFTLTQEDSMCDPIQKTLFSFLLIFSLCVAEVNYHGTVKDEAGTPLPNATVWVKSNPEIRTTTDNQGYFLFGGPVVSVGKKPSSAALSTPAIRLVKNRLLINSRMGSSVSIELFNAGGRRLFFQRAQRSTSGLQSIDLGRAIAPWGLYALRITVGNVPYCYRFVAGQEQSITITGSRVIPPSGTPIGKAASINVDTLLIAANGRVGRMMEVTSVDAELDVIVASTIPLGTWNRVQEQTDRTITIIDSVMYDNEDQILVVNDSFLTFWGYDPDQPSACRDSTRYGIHGDTIIGSNLTGNAEFTDKEFYTQSGKTLVTAEGDIATRQQAWTTTWQLHDDTLTVATTLVTILSEGSDTVGRMFEMNKMTFIRYVGLETGPPWSGISCHLDDYRGIGIDPAMFDSFPSPATNSPIAGIWILVKEISPNTAILRDGDRFDVPEYVALVTIKNTTIAMYDYDSDSMPSCHTENEAPYALGNGVLNGDQWTSEEKDGDDYTQRTTSVFMFGTTMVAYESEREGTIDYNSHGKCISSDLKTVYSYWEPYSGTLPPPAWPTVVCPEE